MRSEEKDLQLHDQQRQLQDQQRQNQLLLEALNNAEGANPGRITGEKRKINEP